MKPTTEQLNIINSRLPGTKMTANMVEILPFRVFDDAVTDRFTVMSKEMMAKVVQDLNEGRAAFNKLHQSREALPVGRSVNARLIENSMLRKEVHANMYAVIQNFDGSCDEDGKELADKYNTGAVYACSAGVQVGLYKCNICGNDIRDWQNCEHSPGRFYKVDEQPKQCIALMTGRNIQDGMAMDCGIYEVSAVTAGGVASAGVLTQTFGQYSDGTDIMEFKKSAFADNKAVNARITFEAYSATPASESTNERTIPMALEEKDVKALIEAQFGTIVADKAKLEVEYKHLEEKLLTATAELTSVKAEYAAKEQAFKAEKETLTATATAYETEKAILVDFKTAYINLVYEAGNKIGKTDAITVYEAKTFEELKTSLVEFTAELNKQFPSGRQTTDEQNTVVETYGIPTSMFKTDK